MHIVLLEEVNNKFQEKSTQKERPKGIKLTETIILMFE